MERISYTIFLFLIAIQGIEISLSESFENNDDYRELDSNLELEWSYERWTAELHSEIRRTCEKLESKPENIFYLHYQVFQKYLNATEKLLKDLEDESLGAEETFLLTKLRFDIQTSRRNMSLLISEPSKFSIEQTRNLKKYLSDSKEWYFFVINVHQVLTTYSYPENKEKILNEIKHKGLCTRENNSWVLNRENLESFAHEINALFVKYVQIFSIDYSKIRYVEISEVQAASLCNVLDQYSNEEPKVSCTHRRMRIVGHIITALDIQNILTTFKNCNFDIMEIFASQNFIIERVIKFPETKNLYIFSPVWDIVPTAFNNTIIYIYYYEKCNFIGVYGRYNSLEYLSDEAYPNWTSRLIRKLVFLSSDNTHKAKVDKSSSSLLSQNLQFQNSLNDYKTFILKKLLSLEPWSSRRPELEILNNHLHSDPYLAIFYNMDGLIDELSTLQKLSMANGKKKDIFSTYKIFAKVVKAKLEETDEGNNQQVLTYLYTTALTTIWSYKEKSELDIVTNIRKYLSNSIDDIHDLEDAINDVAIRHESRRYKENILNEIKKAGEIIGDQLMPEIIKIDQNIQAAIKGLIEEAKKHSDAILPSSELTISFVLQKLSATLKNCAFVSGTLNAFTLFTLAGAMDIVDKNVFDQDALKEALKLPEGVKYARILPEHMLKEKIKVHISILKHLESLCLTPSLNNLKEQIQDYYTILLESLEPKSSFAKYPNLDFQKIQNKCIQAKKEIEQSEASDKNEAVKALEKIRKALAIAELSPDLYLQHKNDINVEKFDYDTVSKKLSAYTEFIRKINNILIPLLADFQENIKLAFATLERSPAKVMEINWKLQDSLKDLNFQIEKFSAGFDAKGLLTNYMEKVSSVLRTMSKIQSTQQNAVDEIELGKYLAMIKSAPYEDIETDPTIGEKLAQLKLITKINLISGFYMRATNAYNKFIFPFVRDFSIDYSCFSTNSEKESCFNETGKKVRTEIEIIMSEIQKSKYQLDVKDMDIRKEYFFSGEGSRPFFTWKNETNWEEIEKLLSGKKLTLQSKLHKNLSAVKFNKIGIKVTTIDDEKQEKLDDILRKLDVSLTHHGTNYYRCGNKCYSTTGKSLHFYYSLQEEQSGQPVSYNLVYKKITGRDFSLSPYTWWDIKLVGGDEDYQKLQEFVGGVHLSLEGDGIYIQNDVVVCKNILQQYFNEEDCQ